MAGRNPNYAADGYWSKPVNGFGDPDARLVIVGLAPGAHGANRTGRPFTGDAAGDWLYRALYEVGMASQPQAVSADDGLMLSDVFITNAVRCVPPDNKPSKE
ncbi:MAG: uracil-DNA glycosylase family protein, partial [Bacillota bacterium]